MKVYIACMLRVTHMRMPEVGELHKVYNNKKIMHTLEPRFRVTITLTPYN